MQIIKTIFLLIVTVKMSPANELIDRHFSLAKQIIHFIGEAEYDSALVYADKGQGIENIRNGLRMIRNVMPIESVQAITLISHGYGFKSGDPKKNVNLLIEIDYGNKIAQLAYSAVDSGGSIVVNNFNYQVIPVSDRNTWVKAMVSKSWKAWLFNFFGFVNVALCLYAIYRCIRFKGLKKKWLWIIFIILPISQISISLPSQEIFFKILSFSFFGYGVTWASAVSPIIISFGFPLGAILLLKKYFKLKDTQVLPLIEEAKNSGD